MPLRPLQAPKSGKSETADIEYARRTYTLGSKELVFAELREFERLGNAAKDADNATNRQKTKARNSMKALTLAAELSPEDEILIDAMAYSYDVAKAEVIDPEKFLELFEKRKFTRAQFINSISVLKSMSDNFVGPHVTIKITNIVPGKELDVRKRKLEHPVPEPVVIKDGKPLGVKKLIRSTDLPPTRTLGKSPLTLKRKLTIPR